MKTFNKLFVISMITGSILAGSLKIVQVLFQVDSYILLFNMDYIPFLRQWNDIFGAGYIFHFVFCFLSIVGVYYLAKLVQLENRPLIYLGVYTIGSAILYFLTALTEEPPEVTSFISWLWWVVAHVIFGLAVGVLIKKWLRE